MERWTNSGLIVVSLLCFGGCSGASARDEGGVDRSIHRAHSERAFVWHEATILPGGLRAVMRTGTFRTLDVLSDGTARIAITFSRHEVEYNGRVEDGAPGQAELRFLSASGGGVSGAMSVLGEPRVGEGLVALLLPFAWPPMADWPRAASEAQTVGISVAGVDSVVTYWRRPGAPEGVDWIAVSSEVRMPPQDATEVQRANVAALLARGGGVDASARVALGIVDGALRSSTEVEMVIGEGVPQPAREGRSLLGCVPEVRAQRSRLDAAPLPPFVLNRPIADALLTASAEEGVGEGVLLDLRTREDGAPLSALFVDLDADMPDRDVAALSVRVRDLIAEFDRATRITAELTGCPFNPGAPIYLLFDPGVPAALALALADAIRRIEREPRVVVRRPATGPREGMLRGSLWPIAERLVERATDCPFIASALAELVTDDVIPSPGWVRAVIAGGLATCNCEPVMADELAREALLWSDVTLQSWGYKTMEEREVPDGATVADLFGG